ncbi:MAG TPA: hypothetical protein VFE96_01145, partial [Candidatus Bathyarchaeia archaeon]|nr:hypothetical protein [Candidatus Bathyarchaeia archaeon]
MSQPNTPEPTPTAPDTTIPVKKQKRIKEDTGGGIGGLFHKLTRQLVWVLSGIIFAAIFFWGLVEIAV